MMTRRCLAALTATALATVPSLALAEALTARDIVERATAAAGGESWRRPETLYLSGYGIFWPGGLEENRVVNERHEMWRVFPKASPEAHVANGKVRIDSWRAGRILFQQSFDGAMSYTQTGPTGQAGDSREWRENFGFGIIRFALDEEARLTRLPDDQVDNRAVYTVRVRDAAGGDTIFAIDKENFRILKAAFATERGWHERIYSDFVEQASPRWVQPMRVRLYYDGVKQNEIVWRSFVVNRPIPDRLFRLPSPPQTSR
jgi:hypothetical protein